MKYLDYPELELLSRALTFESAECRVFTRLEAYSCKAVSKERKLMKELEDASNHEHHGPVSTSLEDPRTQFTGAFAPLDSPFGRLNDPQARKKLFLLITALNAAFPDHDFSLINPADFRREENPAAVLNSLSTTLLNLRGGSGTPRSVLWATYAFFYNRRLKRILFVNV
ncbi:Maf1 regulator, partial [Tilletiaria anomala UBC 951]